MEHTIRSTGHEELLENLGWVQVLAQRLVGQSEADDVGQDVLVKALERPPRAASGPGFRAWLASVTRTQARQGARSATRRHLREERAARSEAMPSAADVVERGEAQRVVVEAVMELEEPSRSAVLLRYLDGLTAVQIAEQIGEQPAAVRKRLSRALETLRARLEKRLGGRKEMAGLLLPLALAPARLVPRTTLVGLPLAAAVAGIALTAAAVWFGGGFEAEDPLGSAAVVAAAEGEGEGTGEGGAETAGDGDAVVGEAASTAAAAPGSVVGGAAAVAAAPAPVAPLRREDGLLLSAVPDDAYALLHSLDPRALRERAERNDWVQALASPDGEPALVALAHEYERTTGTDFDGLVAIATELEGEALLFFTGQVAGFLTVPPRDRATLATVLDGWLTEEPRRAVEVAGGRVQLGTWPQVAPTAPTAPVEPESETEGETGDEAAAPAPRNGPFLASLDHPLVLGLFSGESEEAVIAALTESLGRLGGDRRAPVVEGFLAAGGGEPRGVEAYVDFTPFVSLAERRLREAVEGVLPDPTGILGLEEGTWLYATADAAPGVLLDVDAELRIPEGTLAAELADCFEPLPRTLPADLARGTWATWALHFDLARFYATARAGLEPLQEDGLLVVDQALMAAEAISGVDPVEDLIDQLSGWMAWSLLLDANGEAQPVSRGFGFLAGILDREAFRAPLQAVLRMGELETEPTSLGGLEGVEAYLPGEPDFADGFGIALLPVHLLVVPTMDTMLRTVHSLQRADDAGMAWGSELQGAFDENAGASAFVFMELSHLRAFELMEGGIPEVEENDPLESSLTMGAWRTASGLELRARTR
jgi:RNA polymerase sigma factor (sigma-70 family)